MKWVIAWTIMGVAAAPWPALAAIPQAQTQTIVQDDFDGRTTGSPNPLSPMFGSDWGTPGSYTPDGINPAPASYIVMVPSGPEDVDYVSGDAGRLRGGTVILDADLATPETIFNGNVTISFTVNPATTALRPRSAARGPASPWATATTPPS